MRMTKQRTFIFNELRNNPVHPTASELYQKVRRKLPHISLGTVYRTLNILVSQGYARKIDNGDNESRFDGDVSDHHHLRCLACGKIHDVQLTSDFDMTSILSGSHDFIVEGYNLDFFGICSKCRDAMNNHNEGGKQTG